MIPDFVQLVGAAVGGAVAAVGVTLAYLKNASKNASRNNPRRSSSDCRFSQTAIGQELEPIRNACESMARDLAVVKDRLGRAK